MRAAFRQEVNGPSTARQLAPARQCGRDDLPGAISLKLNGNRNDVAHGQMIGSADLWGKDIQPDGLPIDRASIPGCDDALVG